MRNVSGYALREEPCTDPYARFCGQTGAAKQNGIESKVREIRRKTRRQYSAEERIRIVLEGLRSEESIAALCRREGIATNLYYSWSKEFLEAGKRRLMGDTKRQATSDEVLSLRKENGQLKELVADLSLKNVVLKKSLAGTGGDLDE